MIYIFEGTYTGQGTNPIYSILQVLGDSSKCGENHYFVDIPYDTELTSLLEFFEMNLETQNGKIKPFDAEKLDGKIRVRI